MNLMRIFKFFIIFLFTISFNLTAGPFTDEFSRCIVTKTTSQEKTDLVKWIYVTISFHPQLSDMSNLSSEDVEMVNIRVADYMTNVFAYKCNKELIEAIKYEGENSVVTAFELLGEIAISEIMIDEGVSIASEFFTQYLDESVIAEALSEAYN